MPQSTSNTRALATRIFHSAVAWGFLGSILRAGGGLILLPLMVRYVPPEQLGVWYVFISMGGMVALLDVGLSVSISRATAYLWAGAEDLQKFGVSHSAAPGNNPSSVNSTKLSSLLHSLRLYYRIFGCVCLCILLTAGTAWVVHITEGLEDCTMLRRAWICYGLATSLNLAGALWPSVLLGINRVKEAQQIMAFGSVVNYSLAAAGLVAGLELWALCTGAVAMGLLHWSISRAMFYRHLPSGVRNHEVTSPDWQVIKALWPNSWRTVVYAVGAYLTVGALPLICSAFLSIEETASFGLSLQLATKIVALSAIWVSVKIPMLNQLRAMERTGQLARIFAVRIRLSLLTYAAAAAIVLTAGDRMLSMIGARTPLLDTAQLVLLLTILVLRMHQAQYSALISTENRYPFAAQILVTGCIAALLAAALASRFGVWGLLLGGGIVPVCYVNWAVVRRAVAGLHMPAIDYWRMFLGMGSPTN